MILYLYVHLYLPTYLKMFFIPSCGVELLSVSFFFQPERLPLLSHLRQICQQQILLIFGRNVCIFSSCLTNSFIVYRILGQQFLLQHFICIIPLSADLHYLYFLMRCQPLFCCFPAQMIFYLFNYCAVFKSYFFSLTFESFTEMCLGLDIFIFVLTMTLLISVQFSSVQSLSRVYLFATP